jgi:hypothetical protein
MIEEEKDLLLKDLSTRFPYGIKGQVTIEVPDGKAYDMNSGHLEYKNIDVDVELLGIQEEEIIVSAINDKYVEIVDTYSFSYSDFTPYLRSLLSITEDERKELIQKNICIYVLGNNSFRTCKYSHSIWEEPLEFDDWLVLIDWFNKHHFDYRGLIEKNLAIEVSKKNNPYKE